MSLAGGAVLLYVVVALGYIATSPDLRLRFLLLDDAHQEGIQIRDIQFESDDAVPERNSLKWGAKPEEGDWLQNVDGNRIRNFYDYADVMSKLYHAAPSQKKRSHYPAALESETNAADSSNRRTVEIEIFRDQDRKTILKSQVQLLSVPFGELLTMLSWIFVQIGIFAIAALASWYRPFDRSAHLFYAMMICMLGASVGTFYWWILFTRLWLLVPFVVCAALLPAVALHFFLVYPHPKRIIRRLPVLVMGCIYTVPIVSAAVLLSLWGYGFWIHYQPEEIVTAVSVVDVLGMVRTTIYTYIGISTLYFLGILAALTVSFLTTRNPLEKHQVRVILMVCLCSTVMLAIALWLATFDREKFAHGWARTLSFVASIFFMVAYSLSIVRYKLKVINEVINRSALYYLMSFLLTVGFGLLVAMMGQIIQLLGISIRTDQMFAFTTVLLVPIVASLLLRDRVQRIIDRRFFREKYQLDKALRRMNRMMDRVVDPHSVTELMLGSIVEVLNVKDASLYLRNNTGSPFKLIGSEGTELRALQFALDKDLEESLEREGSAQRIMAGTRSEMTPVQNLLRELNAHLIHMVDLGRDGKAIVALGNKKNTGAFTAEDLTFIEALAQISNIALHGAKLHQDLSRLNDDLKLKVEKISSQERQIAMMQAELAINREDHKIAALEAQPVESSLQRDSIIGNSPATIQVLQTVKKVADSNSSVLVLGESGTGKELLARVIHDNSSRREKPMVSVHCAALSAGLLESELFGHVKGAFTGAHKDKIGRFEAAHGGTLFLDEIGDISLEVQIKLLRVLQERKFEPVGGARTVEVDVRLVTATHQNLEKLIEEGKFREDLYYRLNVISIALPPLRERMEDIYELALHFLEKSRSKTGKEVTGFDEAALGQLVNYPWPGNIRELENVVERAVVMADSDKIQLKDLPRMLQVQTPRDVIDVMRTTPRKLEYSSVNDSADQSSGSSWPQAREMADENEREMLQNALAQTGGNKAQAARLLGMPRSTFYSRLKKYES
ncbi:Transcriptional regulatory protein ZraR [Polystyrenella longa]|uniref:Transcriptional regulatory protein ZraR n=1 Tax=Polystyrenella longa TaxID=2528007 RepID=A0A518CSL6_9PLAN|nr:sigma 54-interacting transcriptional regulator [Polystyrenella longa]QDU82208.1 Transcriptional regulatory protein ZraR [Polystyrenella longa]